MILLWSFSLKFVFKINSLISYTQEYHFKISTMTLPSRHSIEGFVRKLPRSYKQMTSLAMYY